MSEVNNNEQIVWTPQMPDRRQKDRRGNTSDLHTSGKMLNVSDMKTNNDRRSVMDRRKGDRRTKVSVTVTGRAIEVEQKSGNGQ